MRLIDKLSESICMSSIKFISESDIIKNMCPLELGVSDILCLNENDSSGFEGCYSCWTRESND